MPIQPYPSNGDQVGASMVGAPLVGSAPKSVLDAVKCMYAGAALSVLGLVALAVTAGGLRTRIENAHPTIGGKPATAAQITALTHFTIGVGIAGGVIGVVLWLWMARKNGQGRSWARIVASLLFVLCTLDLLNVFRGSGTSAFTIVSALLTWLAGLGATVLLWVPSSSQYFMPQRR
jgi:hypothetical protein